MKNNYWIAMDINGTLFVYCDDCQFHPVCPTRKAVLDRLVSERIPRPWKFDGNECVTADCIPSWAVDVYYSEKLPQSLQESSRS